MNIKKVLSVFLSVLMLMSVLSAGFVGLAAGQNMDAMYLNLANALKKDHVRDLTNYTISNTTLDTVTEGFDTDANGFAYEHRVTAADNTDGDILKAANSFYLIAESLISTTYGSGCYDADTLVSMVVSKLAPYFNDTDETYYEDFYGNRYFPTDEEIAKYNETVSLLRSVDRPVSEASLTSFNIYFMEKDYYNYYNVETILKYFMGNVLKINAGNWYHRFVFVVRTSVDTYLEQCGGIDNFSGNTNFDIRTGIYEFDYYRTYNETKSKSYYAFKTPSADTVYENYAAEFSISSHSADLTSGLLRGGQASGLFIQLSTDTTTIPEFNRVYAMFEPYIKQAVDPSTGKSWDARFTEMTEDELVSNVNNASDIVASMERLTSKYSNAALVEVFGENIGNMMTFVYILKPISQSPTRIVRGASTYTATADKLNQIVRDMDALVYGEDNDTAKRVGTIVKQFFNTTNSLFEGTAVEGMDYVDLNELVKHLVTGLVFRDNIVNLLVGKLYPLIVDLLEEKVYDAVTDAVGSGISGLAEDLINNIIEKNDLAIHPNTLATRINKDYPGVFTKATAVLSAAGNDWEKVNFEAVNWGVDDAPYNQKASLFINALCAGLGGFMRAVVTVMCGDAEYTENAGLKYDDDQFNEYYDKYLINILGVEGYLRAQGGYTKLIVPLFRVLGVPEIPDSAVTLNMSSFDGYVSPKMYHKLIENNGSYRYNYSLRLIVEPIVYWVENVLAERPFETLWSLIPNLVYFFNRQGTSPTPIDTIRSNCKGDEIVDRTHGGIVDGVPQFEQLQKYSLIDILDSIFVTISIKWKLFGLVGVLEKQIDIGSLGELIDKDEMLSTVNGLLNEVLKLEYVVGESGILNTVAYMDDAGNIVMPDSFEYGSEPDRYKTELDTVYTNENETEYVLNEDAAHPFVVQNPEMLKAPYKIPQLQEAKLTSVTTLKSDGKTLNDPNAIGILNTEWNTIDVRNPGVVLMYVLRFVLSALGYKYDANIGVDTPDDKEDDLPMLISCFGLELDNELFQGLNLKDIIYNVMLHPDEAICALLELFYSNENGSEYNGRGYTYPIEKIDYHYDVLLSETINPGKVYGIPVRYTKYWTREYAKDTVSNAEELAGNVVEMLGLEGFEEGFGPYIKNLLDGLAFNNDLMNTLFNTIYQLLGGLNDQVGFDIEAILDAALDIDFSPVSIANTLDAMVGYPTPASRKIRNAETWAALFRDSAGEINDVTLDWGIDNAEQNPVIVNGKTEYHTTHDTFLRTAAALLSPAAFAIRFLFMDQHLNLLGLIELDGYAGYQYAFIGLLEMLSCPGILSYHDYYEKGQMNTENSKVGDANTIYYLLSPILNLLDAVYEDPLTTVLELIPNLMFFISIGGLNDLLNNLVHFAYVLLDILKPIVNGYDLLNGLISNLEISGVQINLSLPLDVDFNGLISDLLGGLLGDTLTIEGVTISLPYIDFHTLCAGTLDKFESAESRRTVHLYGAGGGDLFTALLRLVFEVLFMDENKTALSQILTNLINKTGSLDSYDTKTFNEIINALFGLMEEYDAPDMLLFAVYYLVKTLTPLSGKLLPALRKSDITITELFSSISDDPTAFIGNLVKVIGNMKDEPPTPDDEVSDGGAIMGDPTKNHKGLFDRLKEFFAKLKLFFQKLFGMA